MLVNASRPKVDELNKNKEVGPIGDTPFAVVIAERDPNTRIISLREATQSEIIQWRKGIQNG